MIRSLAVVFTCAAAIAPLTSAASEQPLNLNLHSVALPPESDQRLIKLLLVGDSQMGQSSNRLAGQVQKWDADIVGRLLSCEYQGGAGVLFTSVTGPAYGAVLSSVRVGLGEDHGDGNTGSHFHHSRRFSVLGTIQPNFSELGVAGIVQSASTRPRDFDSRKNARIAVYDMPGGFARFRLSERRGTQNGQSTDFGLPGDPGPTLDGSGTVRWFNQPIRAAGVLGTPGDLPVGVTIRDSNAQDTNRTLNILGTLLHDSPQDAAFPDRGLLVSHVSQSSWSAWDHLNTLTDDALDAIIAMNEGFDTVMIVLGHNREDDYDAITNPSAYPLNLRALAQRITARHAGMGLGAPGFVFVAPWPLGTDERNQRLATQTAQLHDLCVQHSYGFINLFDFFGRQPLAGVMDTPRGSFLYSMDSVLTHPADASTATNLMLDIEWHFDPSNWVIDCPPDLAEPFGVLNFFDLSAFLNLYNAQDPAADLAEPFGTFNFFDIAAFIAAYNAGCP